MKRKEKLEIVFSSSSDDSESDKIILPSKRQQPPPKRKPSPKPAPAPSPKSSPKSPPKASPKVSPKQKKAPAPKPPPEDSSEESIHIDEDPHEEEEDIAPIHITHQVVQPMTTFGLSKEAKKSLFSAKYKFTMHIQGDVKFWAQTKTRYPKGKIPIYEGEEMNESEYYLIAAKSCSLFSLRNKANDGEDLMTMNIMNDASLLRLPRRSNVYLLEGLGVPPLELASRQPSKSARGNWILNFEKRYVVPSVKNTVLYEKRIGERDGSDLLMMRKIGNKAFELDVTGNIPMIAVFAVGLSLCLSK